MDYRGHKAGTTVYFPVFVPGALFFLGDGHAVQGDGEISGTGIETSMQVEFSVDLVKNKPIRWPRGENAEYLFTTGNARPLDPGTTTIGEVMTPDPVTVDPKEIFGRALLAMHDGGFRHVPVVENGEPIGIVSSRSALDPEMEEFTAETQRRLSLR